MANIEPGLAFDEQDCWRVIGEAWSRFKGQPNSQGVTNNSRAPGLFGLVQRRREYLFKQPQADPVLPEVVGEFPRYQTDIIRQKHTEFVSRLVENPFSIQASPSSLRKSARANADVAERVISYGAAKLQESSGIDWQKALAEGLSAYCYGVLHWQKIPGPTIPEPEYIEELDEDDAEDFQLTSEALDGDESKGKYRETPQALEKRAKLLKARHGLPFHVEVVPPDQVAFVDDESADPGPGMAIHIKEIGLIDYNGKINTEGLRLRMTSGPRGGNPKLALEDFDPETEVGMERGAPYTLGMPSIAGWKQRISVACIWTRSEYYELVAPVLITGSSETIVATSGWVLVKAGKHGYGRVPFVRAYATVEENEWDPALRYRPALDGLYQQAPMFNYTRALETTLATRIAIQDYFMTQDVNAPPLGEGDEEGDSVVLPKDSVNARILPPGADLKPYGQQDISAAFVRMRELLQKELYEAAPPTGATEITATTQPWTARLGQAQANAYPSMTLRSIANALAEMFRNWVEIASKDPEEGGLGYGLYVPSSTDNKFDDWTSVVGLEPKEWAGIWLDVMIDPVSAGERTTQTMLDLQLLNNPIHVMTPEQFATEGLGKEDATSWMMEVESYYAVQPYISKIVQQELAKRWGNRVIVSADGSLIGAQGQQVDPMQILAQNGVRQATNTGGGAGGAQPVSPAMGLPPLPPPTMGGLATLSSASGAPPVVGMAG